MTNIKKLLGLAAPLLATGVMAQSTTDANPAILVTTAVATTNVVIVAVPFTTLVNGVTTVLTTEVSTTVGGDVASLTSIAGSISSVAESISSVAESISSDLGSLSSGLESASSVISSVISDITEGAFTLTTVTSVGSNGTATFVSTIGVTGGGGGNDTATGGGGGGGGDGDAPSETGTGGGGQETGNPNTADNVKIPVQMGGLMVAILVAIGML